jgi:hypothetical protein
VIKDRLFLRVISISEISSSTSVHGKQTEAPCIKRKAAEHAIGAARRIKAIAMRRRARAG